MPVDNASEDEGGTAAGVDLFVQFAGVDPSSSTVVNVSGQGVELLDFEETSSDTRSQVRLGHIVEDELRFEDASEITIGSIESVFGTVSRQSFQGNRGGSMSSFQTMRRVSIVLIRSVHEMRQHPVISMWIDPVDPL